MRRVGSWPVRNKTTRLATCGCKLCQFGVQLDNYLCGNGVWPLFLFIQESRSKYSLVFATDDRHATFLFFLIFREIHRHACTDRRAHMDTDRHTHTHARTHTLIILCEWSAHTRTELNDSMTASRQRRWHDHDHDDVCNANQQHSTSNNVRNSKSNHEHISRIFRLVVSNFNNDQIRNDSKTSHNRDHQQQRKTGEKANGYVRHEHIRLFNFYVNWKFESVFFRVSLFLDCFVAFDCSSTN